MDDENSVLAEQQVHETKETIKTKEIFFDAGSLIINLSRVKYFSYCDNDGRVKCSYDQDHWCKVSAEIFEKRMKPLLNIMDAGK